MKIVIVVGLLFFLFSSAVADVDTRPITKRRRVGQVLLELGHKDESNTVADDSVANSDVREEELGDFWARGLEDSYSSMSPTLPNSDLVAFWYKPHYQCDGSEGSTPQESADFINRQLVGGDNDADFAGISEWANNFSIGNPDKYAVIGSVCGYGGAEYRTPVALFYKLDTWALEDSYPKSPSCNFAPIPPWTGPQIGEICVNKTQPDGDNCCSCTYSKKEYSFANDIGMGLGQRPWVAGIFRKKGGDGGDNQDTQKVCVVAGEIPHPLLNSTLYNLNGKATSDPRPDSIARDMCTLLNTDECVPNIGNSSILFG